MSTERSLSDMIQTVRNETSNALALADRLRNANRRLTGGTGQAPTPIDRPDAASVKQAEPPLVIGLNMALDEHQSAIVALENEVTYLERLSETGPVGEVRMDRGVAASSYRT